MKRSPRASAARILSGKLPLLLAVVLMGMAVAQKPSMLLLCITPKGMAATAVRLFMGLVTAVAIRACVPSMARRPPVLRRGRWKILVAFVLMFVLLILVYKVLGSHAFSSLRLRDLVMHRAYLTQSLAFVVLWLAMLK